MARFDPAELPEETKTFLTERHLASLTTLRPDGSPHVTPVGFTFDAATGVVRVITFAGSTKARNVAAQPGARAAVCQIDGARWLTLEGTAHLRDSAAVNTEAEARYAQRYRVPKSRPDRVTIEITVDRVLGGARGALGS